MHLLFCATETNGDGKRLWNLHRDLAPEHGGEFFQTIEGFALRLQQPRSDLTLAVLQANTHEDLLDFLSIRDLLFGIRVILILPDSGENTVNKGFTLLPRFLTYKDEDIRKVEAVVKKMLTNLHPGEMS